MFRTLLMVTLFSAAMVAPVEAQAAGAQWVGGDTDAHGCSPSTGATWSILRRACIQLWTAGPQLYPVKPQGSAIMAASIVFGAWYAHRRVELFLPERKDSLILEWSHGAWRGEGYTLSVAQSVYSLADSQGNLIYAGPPAASK